MKTKGQQAYEAVWAKHMQATTEDEKAEAVRYQIEVQNSLTPEELEQYNSAALSDTHADMETLEAMIEEAKAERMREKLGFVPEALSLSYIAEHYFGKSRAWLYQRINGYKVNGKPAQFTDSERQQLQDALHDIGHKLSQIAIV